MNHLNAIALNLVSLALGSLRGLSLGDVALIIAWTLILIVHVAGQAWLFTTARRRGIDPWLPGPKKAGKCTQAGAAMQSDPS